MSIDIKFMLIHALQHQEIEVSIQILILTDKIKFKQS